MKRVAVIAIFMAVMASLFAFPVIAAGPGVPATAYDSDSVNGVSILTNAYKLYNNAWGTTALPGGSYFPIYISMQIFNNNDQAALVNSVGFTLDLGYGPSGLYNIINYSNDLMISWTSGLFSVSPSNDYSYGNGIVVPPKESLYLIAEIQISVNWDSSTQSWPNTYLNSITNNAYNVGLGDYPYAGITPVDFSPIISYLNSISTDTADVEQNLADLKSILDFLPNSYNNSINSSNISASQTTDTFTDTNGNNHYVNSYVGNPYFVNQNTEYYEVNSGGVIRSTDDMLCVPVYVNYYYVNDTGNTLISSGVNLTLGYTNNLKINNMGFMGLYVEPIDYKYIVPSRITRTNLQFKYDLDWVNRGGYVPTGRIYSAQFILNLYFDARLYTTNISNSYSVQQIDSSIGRYMTFSLTMPNFTSQSNVVMSASSSSQAYYNGEILKEIRDTLNDLYDAYSSVNGLDDIDDAAADVSNKSESAHTQEQSYFTQNAQAIQQTGLSNYRFNGDQENGIGSVSHDFTLLWNALGGFNSIYIFSLTLSLALMILRHAPGVIRSSRRNKEE